MGLRPIAEMQFIDFITCAFNQLINFVAKGHYSGTLLRRSSCADLPAAASTAARSTPLNPEMYFMHTPGAEGYLSLHAYDAKGLLKAAIRDNNPVLFFEHKYLYRRIKEELPAEDYIVPIGKADVRREGKDLTIISWRAMMHKSLEAAEALAKEGIEMEVIDLRTLLPLDEETILKSVKKTNRVIIVHEETKTGGMPAKSRRLSARKRSAISMGRCFA